jgi:heptaprenyl diphosphate synthase
MNLEDLATLLAMPDLVGWLDDVEVALVQSVGIDNGLLVEPGLRVVQGGGKRLRPVLTRAAAALGDPDRWAEDVVKGAVAVELVHVGSLVHDDIMDHATQRRGVPTVNAIEGLNRAVLVGDFLLARSGVEAAQISKEVAQVLAQAISDLCDGQTRELHDVGNLDRTPDDVLRAVRGKTAALLRSSCHIGALAARAPDDAVKALVGFGEAFGMAFQIVDDVLDVVSTPDLMGKPVGNDLREGVYTLPVIFALQGPDGGEVRAELLRAGGDPDRLAALMHGLRSDGPVDQALDVAREFNRAATAALADLPDGPTVEGLRRLPGDYLEWAMAEKAAPAATRR